MKIIIFHTKNYRQETSGGTLKEDVFIVDGMKIKLQVSVEIVRASYFISCNFIPVTKKLFECSWPSYQSEKGEK